MPPASPPPPGPPGDPFEPRYLALHRDGRLAARAAALAADLGHCTLCPRRCGADRASDAPGRCGTGRLARVDAAYPHFGEEPCLSGRGGSGTVFLTGCPLGCLFCQNDAIRRGGRGRAMDAGDLAGAFLALQAAGCGNLNLVTPTHGVPQVLAALDLAAARGLRLPLVWNCGGYEGLAALRLLDGVVDVYLPDLKTLDPARAAAWFDAPDYPEVAREALGEMHRQAGPLATGPDGTARRGLLVRHLVMPGATADALDVLRFLAGLGPGTAVSILAQYRPLAGAASCPGIDRRPSAEEVREVVAEARRLGLRAF